MKTNENRVYFNEINDSVIILILTLTFVIIICDWWVNFELTYPELYPNNSEWPNLIGHISGHGSLKIILLYISLGVLGDI